MFCFVGNSFLGFGVPKLMTSLHGLIQQRHNCSACALNQAAIMTFGLRQSFCLYACGTVAGILGMR